jgi:tetratricopeptide (TPR) repeat protein
MSQNYDKSEKTTIKQKLAIVIQKNSVILLGLLGVLVIVIIGLLIFNSIQLKNLEKSTQSIEIIQDDYEKLSTIIDEDEKNALKNKVLENLNNLINKSEKNYALQRALFIRAYIYFQDNDWDNSIKDFELLAKSFPNSYLAPISLINIAIAYEDSDRNDEAITTYQSIIDKYSDSSSEIPNIYFSIGRLYEEKNDKEAALIEYNNLIDNFPDSNWTNLGRSRIIYLESR